MFGLRFIVFAVISIIFMILDHHHQYLNSTKSILLKLIAPLQYTATWPARVYQTISDNFVSYRYLKAQNNLLQKENLLLKVKLQKILSLQQENAQLRSLLKASFKTQTNQMLIAETLAVDADFFSHEILIDKGSKHGVYIGQAVVDENGVMGQVIHTTPLSSRVLLLSDTRSAIPVQNFRTGMRSLLVGTGSQNVLSLSNTPVTADVRAGDILISSGLDGRYPAGFLVGTVRSVQHRPQEQFAAVTVEPKAQLNRNGLVVLVWPRTYQGSSK